MDFKTTAEAFEISLYLIIIAGMMGLVGFLTMIEGILDSRKGESTNIK